MKQKNIFYSDPLGSSCSPVFNKPNKSAQLVFLIADLKLTPEGDVKILEFGNGMKALYNGYSQVANKNMLDQFWGYLTQNLNLPVFYVKSKQMLDNPQIMAAVARQYDLTNLEQHFNGTLGDLNLLDYYQKYSLWGEQRGVFDPNNIYSYAGALITDHCLSMDEESKQEISQRYPELIHLNSTNDFNFIISNKIMSNTLFGDGLQKYKPSWVIRDKGYSPLKAQGIINTLQSDYYVIKPIDSCKGNGIIVSHKDDLDKHLQMISHAYELGGNIGRVKSNTLGGSLYWRFDKNPYFLIEEYVPSIDIYNQEKVYDPTMRIAFSMQYYDDFIKTDYFGAYWKLPVFAKDKDNKTISSLSSVSKISSSGPSALAVSDEHRFEVIRQLNKVLPDIYLKLLNNGAVGLSRFLLNDDIHNVDYARHILKQFGVISVPQS